jgi:hypothetical protein
MAEKWIEIAMLLWRNRWVANLFKVPIRLDEENEPLMDDFVCVCCVINSKPTLL